MKKTLFFLMLSTIVALTSCKKEDTPVGEPSAVTFNVAAQNPITKAVNVTRYVVEVYAATDLNTRLQRKEESTGTITVDLDNNIDYVCLFWADEGTKDDNSNGTYNALDLKNVTLNSGKEMGEAFFAKQNISGSVFTHNITLKRPIAQVNFVATDNVAPQTNLVVTFDQHPGFNTMTEDVQGTAVSTSKTFNSAATTGTLGSLFTFVSTAGITRTFVAVYNVTITNTIPNAALKANFNTNLIGSYASGYRDITAVITVDEYWANTIDWIEINTGTSGTPNWIQVADRNAEKGGTHGATAGATATDYGYYYNWSNVTTAPSNVDKSFKACFDFAEGNGVWRQPTQAEWLSILGTVASNTDNATRKLQFDSGETVWKLHDMRAGKESQFVYLPIAGRRENDAGASGALYVGIEGHYWSSTISATYPWGANFDNTGNSHMTEVTTPTYAYPVRCVRTGTGI